jgi:DMSO/TMAO reductase YedYZ molybdopterin-dependent catalytic subunit
MARTLRPSRRHFLKMGAISSGFLLAGFDKLPPVCTQQKNAFTGGKQLGTVDFVYEGPVQMDSAVGVELDGRLYTDLSRPTAQNRVTPTERFYIRTRASKLLPDAQSWQVRVDGLVERPLRLTMETLKRLAKPTGLHLMECAGNARMARFGMISVADWEGVPLSEILDAATVKAQATRVLIAGFDQYATKSLTSVPGASWVFSLEELQTAGPILATKMNRQQLTLDHGAPIRLVVPGWYGCASIKWVNNITLVDDAAEATSQMQEYASRTLQDGVPRLAKDYRPASVDHAAMPIRIEKWVVAGKLKYRVIGILWGGSQAVRVLQIRFNPDEDYVRVDGFCQTTSDPWTIWTHAWSPQAPGVYAIRLAVTDPPVQARKLDAGYYIRAVEITEV